MHAELDVAVVGGGTAGLTAALTARHHGASVALIEAGPRIGGDCTFFGCVPSKTLIEAAQLSHQLRAAGAEPLSFEAAMARVRRAVEEIADDERDERFTAAGIEVTHAEARFLDEHTLEAGGRTLRARRIVIATGSAPAVPDGVAGLPHYTNETIFSLERLPERLAVLGGGATGLELAQAFRRLGSEVTLVEAADRILPRDEPEAGAVIAGVLRAEGIELRLGTTELPEHDTLLVATGRRAVLPPGLEVELEGGYVKVDRRCRTSLGHVFAAGDVTGGLQFTHVASHEGLVAGKNAAGKRAVTDERVVPSVTFTDPEVAHVGLTEAEARERHRGVEVHVFPMRRVDRARILERREGFVKLVSARRPLLGRLGGGVLVGAEIVAPRAGELIQECALAIRTRCFAGRLAQTIHAYPTMSVALQQAESQLTPLGRVLAESD